MLINKNTRTLIKASEMTYIVSSGALNSTHSSIGALLLLLLFSFLICPFNASSNVFSSVSHLFA